MKYPSLFFLLALAASSPALAVTQNPKYDAIAAATLSYVHKEHSSDFNPVITCIQLVANGNVAVVNYLAGPKGDPVATTLTLVQPASVSLSTLTKLPHVSAPTAGWSSVAATTSAFSSSVQRGFAAQAAAEPNCLPRTLPEEHVR